MQNKLQELTDRLYNEGLSKGKEEGARILEDATRKAEEIIAKANAVAEAIKAAAEAAAADLKAKTEYDVKMAAAQSLQATRADIENLVVGKISAGKVDATLADKDFIKEIIRAAAAKFSTEGGSGIAMMLPASMQDELEPWISGQLSKELGAEVSASFTKKIAGGFTIGPKDGGWFISLSDGTFKELIAEYLRPVTRKLLFG